MTLQANDPIRCRYEDCPEQHPVVPEEDDGINTQRVTCPTCRADLDLPPISADDDEEPMLREGLPEFNGAFG